MTRRHVPLTEPQLAALAKVACGIEANAGVALLCGPPGVGKTTVLEHLAADPRFGGHEPAIRDAAAWLARGGDLPPVVLADDAHLASEQDLSRLLAWAHSRRPAAALVLAGQGRLLTLVARDRRLERAVRIQASLLPGTLGDTAALLAAAAERPAGPRFDAPAVITIHEIAGGTPGDIIRLADLAEVVAASRTDGRVTTDEVEAVHRRLVPSAA